ncbi:MULTISPECIES: hypothetical protein [Pasteurellaceae]|uniref:hypothetical protein n=1 Tax=Pasteurellaceae TaxID=712 RepID=UPI003569884F
MKILSLISLFFLSSCFYSNGCIYTQQMVNCFDKSESFSPIAHYQKEHSTGATHSEQRWKDVVSCGRKYGDERLRSAMTKDKNGPIDETMQKNSDNV